MIRYSSWFAGDKIFMWIYGFITLILAIFTFGVNYSQPPANYWDEVYHISSAEKYREGVFFMEPHPPLGKLLIASGEQVLQPNKSIDLSSFVHTDQIKEFPSGYSFAGVRLFPVIFAILTAPLLFLLLARLVRNPHIAIVFASFYIFDNALVLHLRGAMLEGIQLFFIVSSLLYFTMLWQQKAVVKWWQFGLLGIAIGLNVSTKVNGLVLGLLPFILLLRDDANIFALTGSIKNRIYSALKIFSKPIVSLLTLILVFASVFYIHFAIATKVIDNKYYGASDSQVVSSDRYKDILNNGQAKDLTNFIYQLGANIKYIDVYNNKVPQLKLGDVNENGSSPWTWPIGNKTIAYRWQQHTDDNGIKTVSYLYLVPNPVVWLIALIGVILSLSLIISRLIFGLPIRNVRIFYLICIFALLYISYMVGVLQIHRVMYLYHYFIPLVLSFALGALIFAYLFNYLVKSDKQWIFYSLLLIIFFAVFISFAFYSPLTYYKPLNESQFQMRNILPAWQMKWKGN